MPHSLTSSYKVFSSFIFPCCNLFAKERIVSLLTLVFFSSILKYFDKFTLPEPFPGRVRLGDVLDDAEQHSYTLRGIKGDVEERKARWSLSCNEQGFNDYFLFNDLRNGDTTIHSWDIAETTDKEKQICNLLLTNRRKRYYGELDGIFNHLTQRFKSQTLKDW